MSDRGHNSESVQIVPNGTQILIEIAYNQFYAHSWQSDVDSRRTAVPISH